MNDNEALEKVRARMVEWQAYVAQPRAKPGWANTGGEQRAPESVQAVPFGLDADAGDCLAISAEIDSHAGEKAERHHPDRPFPDRAQRRFSRPESGSPPICWEPLPVHEPVDLSLDGVYDRLNELKASLHHEREQARRLTEIVLQEQLLQAYLLRSGVHPRWSTRQPSSSPVRRANSRRRARVCRDWCMLITWILILIAGAILIRRMYYG